MCQSTPFRRSVKLGNRIIGANLTFSATDSPQRFDDAQLKLLTEGKSMLVVTSIVAYKDIFGATHASEWIGCWNQATSTLSLGFCPEGLLDNPRFY